MRRKHEAGDLLRKGGKTVDPPYYAYDLPDVSETDFTYNAEDEDDDGAFSLASQGAETVGNDTPAKMIRYVRTGRNAFLKCFEKS
jgi:hypothetical protein